MTIEELRDEYNRLKNADYFKYCVKQMEFAEKISKMKGEEAIEEHFRMVMDKEKIDIRFFYFLRAEFAKRDDKGCARSSDNSR